MALIGIQLDRTNPAFTSADFTFWMPQFKKYIHYFEGKLLLGSTNYNVSLYNTDYTQLTIGNNLIELTTLDEIVYSGTIQISQSIYTISLNVSTMKVTATIGETTTLCTLKSEGNEMFAHLYEIANNKIFKSIYGTDWKLAMSLCIAHYLTLISNQVQAPAGNTLQGIAGGATHGVLSDMSVGAFHKSYDLSKTMVSENEAMFWNETSYGSELMALLKTKAVPSILVVTSNNLPGAN